MEGVLTMACYQGNPSIWIVGQKVTQYKRNMLKSCFFFVSGNNQIGLTALHGGGKECDIDFGTPLLSYPVQDDSVRDLYIQATTGIQPMRAPLANPGGNGPGGKILPFGTGPRN
jgi:hypothetical protein